MAAAVVAGILIALAAVMFNFSVHKIDEGESYSLESQRRFDIIVRFAFSLWCLFYDKMETFTERFRKLIMHPRELFKKI